MTNSTALVYRQFETLDQSGTGAGTQWLHALWHIYQYLFVDCEAVDSGRWELVTSSPVAASWSTASNIVDNSYFVVSSLKGRRQWQAKFQATNVTALDESPSTSYSLVVTFSNDGGWGSKGGANGGFSSSSLTAGINIYLGGTDVNGTDGSIILHGDRDTLLLAIAANDSSTFNHGGYIGRFDPFVDEILYPECVLGCWDGTGSPKGFDRSSGGVFSTTPGSSHALNNDSPTPSSVSCQVWCPAWLTSARQPDIFSSQYTYRPLELSISTSPLGYLRHVWACSGLASKSRMDYRRKLVLNGASATDGVCIKHNGTSPP